jgi:hypothetical protein
MKTVKGDGTRGDTKGARDFNHGERSRKIRRIISKKATRRTIKELDKSDKDSDI